MAGLRGRAGGRRPHRPAEQPRPGVLPGPRGDQARPGAATTSPVADGIVRALRDRPCMLHRFPTGVTGEKVHQKRLPSGAPGLGADRAGALPALEPARRRAVRAAPGRRGVGGADVHGGVPPVELPARRHREARRVAHRHRPDARGRATPTCAGSRTSPTRCSTSWAPPAGRRRPAARACTSTCGSRPTTGSPTSAGPRTRSPARSARRCDLVDLTWWRKDRDPASIFVDYNQNTRDHTIRSAYSVRGVPEARGVHPDPLGRDRRRRPARLHHRHGARRGSPSWATCTPASTTPSSCIDELLEWADRDAREGAEEPPDPVRTSDPDATSGPDALVAANGTLGRDLRARRCRSRHWGAGGGAQAGELRDHLRQLPVRVQPAGVGQHPHPGARRAAPPAARPTARGRAERRAVGRDPDDREPGRGRCSATSARSRTPPATSSAGVSSSARAVARATMFVMPSPSAGSSPCSAGRSSRGVNPAPCSAGQNRLPGRAKWCPVAALTRPGLMPQNSTRSGGSPGPGSTSRCVRSRAASSSARVKPGTWR